MLHPKKGNLAFTLIELLVAIIILAVITSLLLPALSTAKKKALEVRLKRNSAAAASGARAATIPAAGPGVPPRPLAVLKSFSASAALQPGLSVGSAEPESIYTARLHATFTAFNPGNGECEVYLPLPPQIISLAQLEVAIDSRPSESVEIRGDKLVWTGVLPSQPTPMSISYSAVGKGLYNLEMPPGGILDTFHIDLTAVGSDVRMLELSLQPTKLVRANNRTQYTWDYQRLLFGRPIALDVLGLAPIDRLGELAWLGPMSVVVFGLVLGLVARALNIQNFDRWMLLLILGTFSAAYPLMYFAQEFIALNPAILLSCAMVLLIIGIRSATIMGVRVAFSSTIAPAAAILSVTLLAALHTRLQGILITITGIALFVVAMSLMPRLKIDRFTRPGPTPLASGANPS